MKVYQFLDTDDVTPADDVITTTHHRSY